MNLFRRMLVVVGAALLSVAPAVSGTAGCADLSGLPLPAAAVTMAEPAGQYTAPNGQRLSVPDVGAGGGL
jgi:hypothetical protein